MYINLSINIATNIIKMNTLTINDQKNLGKRPIASTLAKMQLNDIEIFPIIQTFTIRNAINRIQLFNRSMKFTTNIDNDIIKVTRTA